MMATLVKQFQNYSSYKEKLLEWIILVHIKNIKAILTSPFSYGTNLEYNVVQITSLSVE